MPDISMCLGGDCPQKEKCYRFTAEPSPYRQSYFCDPPFEHQYCSHFWSNKFYEIRRVPKTRQHILPTDSQ